MLIEIGGPAEVQPVREVDAERDHSLRESGRTIPFQQHEGPPDYGLDDGVALHSSSPPREETS